MPHIKNGKDVDNARDVFLMYIVHKSQAKQAERVLDMKNLVSNPFVYWKDGNTPITYSPPLPEDRTVFPYVVRISNRGWIPVNVLVFATSTDHASARVLDALKECAEKDYHGSHYRADGKPINRAHILLRELDENKLTLDVAPYPTECMSKLSWAMNDTITG